MAPPQITSNFTVDPGSKQKSPWWPALSIRCSASIDNRPIGWLARWSSAGSVGFSRMQQHRQIILFFIWDTLHLGDLRLLATTVHKIICRRANFHSPTIVFSPLAIAQRSSSSKDQNVSTLCRARCRKIVSELHWKLAAQLRNKKCYKFETVWFVKNQTL